MSHVGIAVQSADVLVTTGNLEAIYRAIRYRVPVLVFPQTAEDRWYAQQVADLGIGIWRDNWRSDVRSSVDDLLNQRAAFSPSMMTMTVALARYDALSQTQSLLRSLLKSNPIAPLSPPLG